MNLLMVVLLYSVCTALIRGVLIKVFVGNAPSARRKQAITLIALLWPVWPELAIIAVLGFALENLIVLRNDN